MSCFLARECAFGGLGAVERDDGNGLMREACEVDFTGIAPTVQTASTCGKFYLIAKDAQIYVYQIEGLTLRLLSKLSCGHNVQVASIAASEHHFAIAAILDGRMGLHVDLSSTASRTPLSSPWECAGTLSNGASSKSAVMDFGAIDGPTSCTSGAREIFVGDFDELSLNAGSLGSSSILHSSVHLAEQHSWSEKFHRVRARVQGIRQTLFSHKRSRPDTVYLTKMRADGKVYRAFCPEIVYKNICSEDDPPRSVAISPTRQCIAFGCKTGIELYWVSWLENIFLFRPCC